MDKNTKLSITVKVSRSPLKKEKNTSLKSNENVSMKQTYKLTESRKVYNK